MRLRNVLFFLVIATFGVGLLAAIAHAAEPGPFDDPPGQWLGAPGTHGNAWQTITSFVIETAGQPEGCAYVGIGKHPTQLLPLPETDYATNTCLPEVQSWSWANLQPDGQNGQMVVSVWADFPTKQHATQFKVCDPLGRSTVIKITAFVGCHS